MSHAPAHDAQRRFEAIAHLAQQLALAPNARVLDVGGFPGTLRRQLLARFPGWSIHVADSARGTAEAYTMASGAALPFAEGAFDLVISSDTLEHVPSDLRPPFLAELCRVSRHAIVICAPFDHPVTAQIEGTLNEAHKEATSRPHPWLAEHVENGLPSLDETCRVLSTNRPTSLFFNAPLWDWMQWQWGALARDLSGAFDASWDTCNAQLNASWKPEGDCIPANSPRLPLCYRAILVAAHELPFESLAPDARTLRMPTDDREQASCLAYNTMMQALVMEQTRAFTSGGAATVDARLREALVLAEQEVSKWRERATEARNEGLLARLRRKRP